MSGLYERTSDGRLTLRQHPGQLRGWDSDKRIIAILAGTQGGKTSWLPWWLWREVRRRGPGDYLAVTASYDLFKLKFLPALREVFEHTFGWGRYWKSDRIIELADPVTGRFAEGASDPMWGRIILRSAESGSGLESSSAKGAIFDEAGMDSCTVETWEALQRRLALHQGRVCLGTTLYNLGWLKQKIYDPWAAANRDHPEIDVIQFDSTANPTFPQAEYDRAMATMPRWRFNMQYRGIYERPAGLIYDCYDPLVNSCPRFSIPDDWPRYGGLDFGGVNTAAILLAEEPAVSAADGTKAPGRLFAYREYHAGDRTAEEHARAILKGEPRTPFFTGGAKSEGQWRKEFRKGGIPVAGPPISEVEIQIGKVYAALKSGGLVIFDDLAGLLADLQDYQRVVDADGEPTEKILNENKYHHHAALRYIISRIR